MQEALFPPDAALITAIETELLDWSLSDSDRVSALRRLIGILSRAEDQSLSAAAIDGVIALATTATDPEVRSSVWTALSAAPDDRLLRALGDALLYDSSEQVRLAAVVALQAYDNDMARSMLAAAGRSDDSAEVRRNARWASLSEAGRRELLASSLLNSQLSTEDRLAQLEQAILPPPGLSGIVDLQAVIDNNVAAAIGELIADIGEPTRRSALLMGLERFSIPELAPALMARLRNDADMGVRASAGRSLRRYRDEPGVREALAAAAANDSSETVRAIAAIALAAPQPDR
jgi:HEAT repeat protein